MKHINHPNIVKLHEVLSSHSKIYLVLEYVEGGELLGEVKNKGFLSEDDSRKYFQQIISGVSFCQLQHIAHRDLKLENILLDVNLNVKISDFGLSGLFKFDNTNVNLMHTTCGTVNYLAPEVFGNQGYDGHVADIWSCGVILFALLSGRLPFVDDSISRLIENIVSGRYEPIPNISSDATDLLKSILVTDPRMRISIPNIKKHKWFNINFIEPEGTITDCISPYIENIEHLDNKPRNMNAFELLNFSAGIIINKLFDNDQPNFTNHFMSNENPEEILRRINLAMTNINCKEKSREGGFSIIYETKTAPMLCINAEIFDILPDLYLISFTRINGGLTNFKRVVNSLLNSLGDISTDHKE